MQLLAVGRDCDVFDLGDGTVLRRSREGRSQAREAAALRHARAHGVPCPEVVRLGDDGIDLVLELVPGPTQLHDLLTDPTPERIADGGRVLAELHERMHRVPPIGGTGDAGDGAAFLHLDLHPANVLLSPDGPVLIDFANATDGSPGLDLAKTWVIITGVAGDDPFATILLDAFLDAAGRDEARQHLAEAGRRWIGDPHASEAERANVVRLLEREGVVGQNRG